MKKTRKQVFLHYLKAGLLLIFLVTCMAAFATALVLAVMLVIFPIFMARKF